jgi:hypothetical protein
VASRPLLSRSLLLFEAAPRSRHAHVGPCGATRAWAHVDSGGRMPWISGAVALIVKMRLFRAIGWEVLAVRLEVSHAALECSVLCW